VCEGRGGQLLPLLSGYGYGLSVQIQVLQNLNVFPFRSTAEPQTLTFNPAGQKKKQPRLKVRVWGSAVERKGNIDNTFVPGQKKKQPRVPGLKTGIDMRFLPQSHGQNLALTVLYVPYS